MAFTVLLLLGICVSTCNTCSCWMDQGPQRFCGFDIVFRGEVKSSKYEGVVDLSDSFALQFATLIYTVQVKEAFVMPDSLKANSTIHLRTTGSSSLCGATLPLDVDMVVIASYRQEEARTSLCLPNSAWVDLSPSDRQFIASNDRTCP